jgi:hypothetical protein
LEAAQESQSTDSNNNNNNNNLATELEAAEMALDQAVACYVDLLDGLRNATVSQQARFEEYRNALPLKQLRNDLDQLKKKQQPENP